MNLKISFAVIGLKCDGQMLVSIQASDRKREVIKYYCHLSYITEINSLIVKYNLGVQNRIPKHFSGTRWQLESMLNYFHVVIQ